jgi:hypothetical protein
VGGKLLIVQCTGPGCHNLLPPRKDRKHPLCYRCYQAARRKIGAKPPQTCIDCGVSISPRARTGRCHLHSRQRPEARERVRESNRQRAADPTFRQQVGKKISARWKDLMADPETRKAIQERMRAVGKAHGGNTNRDDFATARKTRNTKLAHIPLAYRDEYIRLGRSLKIPARERKRIVLDEAAAAVRAHNKKFNQE